MKARFWVAIAALATASAVVAGHHGFRYLKYVEPTRTTACVQVKWEKDEATMVEKYGASGWLLRNKGSDEGYHLMVVPKPRGGFNDHRTMEIIGHEFLHAVGADHD